MDYLYNERSWLTQINHQNLYDDDKFGEVIGYNVQNHIASGSGFNFQAQYNGNISWNIMRTKNAGLEGVDAGYPDPIIGYVYNYDGANRLTKADFGYYNLNPDYTIGWSNSLPKAAMYDLPLISYYANGNIFNLQRKGADALMMDNFTYFYQSNKNRLVSIMNTANGTQIYNYGYDNNGNVTSDQFRGISGITYNISNLPEKLTADGSIVKYWYDNNGNRIRKQESNVDEVYVLGSSGQTEAVFNADGTIKFFNINSGKETIGRFAPTPVDLYLSNTTLNGTYEAQNSITVEYNVNVSGPTTLKAGNNIHLKPGFNATSGIDFSAKIGAVFNTPKRFYYLKDHLGSVRVVVNETGDIVSSDDYDPWGMILNGRSTNIAYVNSKYKFTGKERDNETGYDYFGARYYDSRIGRWMQVDPLVEKYFGWSPYNYTLNDPVRLIDPAGKQVGEPDELKQVNPVNILATSFIDFIHSAENILLNAAYLYGASQGKLPPGFKYQAGYATDEFGNEIFKTEIKLVPTEGLVSDVVGYGLDVANVSLGGKVGDGASLLAKVVGKSQVIETVKMTLKEATAKAKELGFSKVKDAPFYSHGEPVFKKGTKYLTPDIDQHKGGVWKMFDKKGNRLGTYDEKLNRIGD